MTPLQQVNNGRVLSGGVRRSALPTHAQLLNMPIAYSMVLTLTSAEIAKLRAQLYAMNRTTERQYYTRRCGARLYVFRVL